jgi:hypothetical protein
MTEFRAYVFQAVTMVLAVLLLPYAFLRARSAALQLACQWALSTRFPAEDLSGLTGPTLAAFTAARTTAFWRYGQLLGLTSGQRDAAEQSWLFVTEVLRTGSEEVARQHVLPAEESPHVRGVALDVRPREGARWLEKHGAQYCLFRTYDNEWWHFEYRPETGGIAPARLPHPGVQIMRTSV